MKNKYLDYVTDEHLLSCIANLHTSYLKAKNNLTKEHFYRNKVDVIKLTFDSKFNAIDEESLIEAEVLRQIDKSINNAIGTFHEQVLGGIKGFEVGNLSGFDIMATDNTLFADIHHNTIHSRSIHSLFERLADHANIFKSANCYWVQIFAERSFNEKWQGVTEESSYSHKRVFKISGDQFYALLSGQEDAFFQLNKVLPNAIKNYLGSIEQDQIPMSNSILNEIRLQTKISKRSILEQINFENYSSYLGFDKM